MPITFALPLQAFRIYRNNNNNNSRGGKGVREGKWCQLCWHRKISAWPESENGRWRERERECNIYCLQSLVYYFTCISLGSLLPLFTLPPTPLLLPLCWYSSGSFVIYVALCRAWLARTFVNSKRPVSISWQASLYTVCPESATLPPPLPPSAAHPCRHWTWLCGFFMF